MSRPLPLWTRAVYGSGDWSLSSFNTLRNLFYASFLTDVVGLDPRLASFSALIGVLWDAINDPLVGMLSDRVQTRWGRRRPFLLAFAVPFGMAFVGLWWAPPWQSQWALAVHVALAYMISDTLQSLVTVPFFALTPELTPDADERTSLVAWRMFFNLSASLAVAVAAPGLVDTAVGAGLSAQRGYLLVGALFGGLGALPPLLIAALLRERPDADPDEEPPPIPEILSAAWANVPFRYLTALYLLNWITFDLVGLMIPYFVTWWLGSGSAVATTSALGVALPVESAMLGALLVVSILALPVWTALSSRLGKSRTYALAMSLWLSIQLGVGMVPPGSYGLAVALAAACGLGVAAAHVLPDAMLPDVIDLDEFATGRRSEGIYYGARNLFRKAGGALAMFLALQILGWTGYRASSSGPEVVQPEEALWAIRLLTGPAGALLLGGAILCAWLYPLTRERHLAVQRALAERRAAPAQSVGSRLA